MCVCIIAVLIYRIKKYVNSVDCQMACRTFYRMIMVIVGVVNTVMRRWCGEVMT